MTVSCLVIIITTWAVASVTPSRTFKQLKAVESDATENRGELQSNGKERWNEPTPIRKNSTSSSLRCSQNTAWNECRLAYLGRSQSSVTTLAGGLKCPPIISCLGQYVLVGIHPILPSPQQETRLHTNHSVRVQIESQMDDKEFDLLGDVSSSCFLKNPP